MLIDGPRVSNGLTYCSIKCHDQCWVILDTFLLERPEDEALANKYSCHIFFVLIYYGCYIPPIVLFAALLQPEHTSCEIYLFYLEKIDYVVEFVDDGKQGGQTLLW